MSEHPAGGGTWRAEVPGALWTADMPFGRFGFSVGARMTALRLPSGGLWLHSPVALTPGVREGLAAAGPVTDIVAPSRFHHGHVREAAAAFPQARVWVPPDLARRYGDLQARPLADGAPPEWEGAVSVRAFRGSRLYDELDFHHAPTGTLVVTDLVFNIPEDSTPATRRWARWLGILGAPAASRSFRWMVRDRAAVRDSLAALLAWDWDRLLLTHGSNVPTGGRDAFRRAFQEWL